jgi:hypothetical protein
VILDAVNINSSSGVSCESNCSNSCNSNTNKAQSQAQQQVTVGIEMLKAAAAYHHHQNHYQDKSQLYYLHWSDNNTTNNNKNDLSPNNAKYSQENSPMSKVSNISDYIGLKEGNDECKSKTNGCNLDQRILCYSDLLSSTASTLKNRDGPILIRNDSYLYERPSSQKTNNISFKPSERYFLK